MKHINQYQFDIKQKNDKIVKVYTTPCGAKVEENGKCKKMFPCYKCFAGKNTIFHPIEIKMCWTLLDCIRDMYPKACQIDHMAIYESNPTIWRESHSYLKDMSKIWCATVPNKILVCDDTRELFKTISENIDKIIISEFSDEEWDFLNHPENYTVELIEE